MPRASSGSRTRSRRGSASSWPTRRPSARRTPRRRRSGSPSSSSEGGRRASSSRGRSPRLPPRAPPRLPADPPEEARVVLVEGLGRLLSAFDEELARSAEQAARLARGRGAKGRTRHGDRRTGVSVAHGEAEERIPRPHRPLGGGRPGEPARAFARSAPRPGRARPRRPGPLRSRATSASSSWATSRPSSGRKGSSSGPRPGGHAGRHSTPRPETSSPSSTERRRALVYKDKGERDDRPEARHRLVFGLELSGAIAWWVWLLVHILYLIGFRSRVLVLIEWAWAYVTYERGARLHHERASVDPGVLLADRARPGDRADDALLEADARPPRESFSARSTDAHVVGTSPGRAAFSRAGGGGPCASRRSRRGRGRFPLAAAQVDEVELARGDPFRGGGDPGHDVVYVGEVPRRRTRRRRA